MCSSSGGQNCIIQHLISSQLQVAVPCTVAHVRRTAIYLNNNGILCMYSETIERVTQFAYLGSIIDNTGVTVADITALI